MLYPNEVVIGDHNWRNHVEYVGPDEERRAKGLVPRDLMTHPPGYSPNSVLGIDFPLIPESEWSSRIADKVAAKSRISDLRLVGNNGQVIPSLDQNGKGYCWAHSSTSAVTMLRCVQNQPYVPLSAYAIACIIKSYRDEGGWGCQSLDFICDRGVPSDKFWPMQSMSRSNDKPETWENAKLHRVTEGWNDLSVAQYDRNLTYAQVITLLLSNIPVVVDFNWWSHSVCAIDAVDGASCRPTYRGDNGKKPSKKEFDLGMGMDDPVTAGVNIRILNSWGDSWSDRGMGVLTGSKAVPNGSGAPRVTGASVN